MKQNQFGRSMIEMLGVLAIIGVLSVGGIAGYSKAMEKFKANKWRQQVEDLIFNIKEAYKFQGQYGREDENILPTLKNIGIVPQEMLDANNIDILGNRLFLQMRSFNGWIRLNLQFVLPPAVQSQQTCSDLFQFMNVYNSFMWDISGCSGANCDYPWFYTLCGNAAPKEYWELAECKKYDLTMISNACKICTSEPCTIVMLFDNNT